MISVGVTIQVSEGDYNFVQVMRLDTVQNVPDMAEGTTYIDLVRSVCSRLAGDAQHEADQQIGQLRDVLEKALPQ